jgi:glucosamine--fructose-6-phosphate aminotransferase (isomerizing)
MCGIVGYVGTRNAAQIIVDGLQPLEYLGRGSAVIAVVQDGEIGTRSDVEKLGNLVKSVSVE